MIGWQTPPLTTSFSRTSSLDSIQNPQGRASDTSSLTRKRRKVICRDSPPPSAPCPCPGLDCNSIPDVPELHLLPLEQVWTWARARVVMPEDPRAPALSSTSVSKTWGTYTSRIFKHRSIRYRQGINHEVLYIGDVKENVTQYQGDLVLADETEGSAGSLDRVIRSLKQSNANERTWESDLYYPHFFLQALETPIGSLFDPPTAVRLVQHPMKTILHIPHMSKLQPYYASFPPIVSRVDRRLTEGNENAPPWIAPIKEGKVVNDIVYAVNDHEFWDSALNGEWRETARAKLAGYNLFGDSDDLLPYLLIEDKRHEGINSKSLDYAKACLIFIAASLLHQRLKLRAVGKMRTTLNTSSLVMHCIAMAGKEAHYLRVGLRGPFSSPPNATDTYFVRYEGEVRGVFDLTRWRQRNLFKALLRTIHAFGSGAHQSMQKEEVANALSAINAEIDNVEPVSSNSSVVRSRDIMSNDVAFQCVPAAGEDGDYVLEYTDMTINSQTVDELDASETQIDPNDLETSEAGTRALASSSTGSITDET